MDKSSSSDKKDKNPEDENPFRKSASVNAMEKASQPLTMTDLMETYRHIKGVVAVMMMNSKGLLGKSSFDKATSGMYCGLANQILNKVTPLLEKLNPTNRLRTIRSNGGGQELLISPIKSHDLIFVIIQNCADRESIASNSVKLEKKKKHKSISRTVSLVAGESGTAIDKVASTSSVTKM